MMFPTQELSDKEHDIFSVLQFWAGIVTYARDWEDIVNISALRFVTRYNERLLPWQDMIILTNQDLEKLLQCVECLQCITGFTSFDNLNQWLEVFQVIIDYCEDAHLRTNQEYVDDTYDIPLEHEEAWRRSQ